VKNNEAGLTFLDLTNNPSFRMKAVENTIALADALKTNTVITRLVLRGCEINDEGAAALGKALIENHTIEEVDLQQNRITTWGVISLTEGLAQNKGVTAISLLDQAAKFGDDCVEAFITVFSSNITLNKIMWQTESVRLWELSKLITRNVELQKRQRKGEDISVLLPKALGGQGGFARVDVAAERVEQRKKTLVDIPAFAPEPSAVAKAAEPEVEKPTEASTDEAAEPEVENPTKPQEDDDAVKGASSYSAAEPESGKPAEPQQMANTEEAVEEEAAEPEVDKPTESQEGDDAGA